jgi:hypothetical protein
VSKKLLGKYWLYQWIDEEEIRRPADYLKAIRKPRSFDRLRELSEAAYHEPTPVEGSVKDSVVAARRIDMSGMLGCPHFDCMTKTVESVFGRGWQYFDSIIIDSQPLDELLFTGDDIDDLAQQVKLMLYFRRIGAEKHIKFTHKVSGLCNEHFRQYAIRQKLGLDALFDTSFEDGIVQKLLTEGDISVSLRDDQCWHYEVWHPDTDWIKGQLSHSDPGHRPSDEQVARSAFGACFTGLISDVSASRALGVPLLQAAQASWVTHNKTSVTADANVAALNLRLPVLRGLPAREILKLRNEDWSAFERFRTAIRQAIREQNDRLGSGSPEEVANAVVKEYVQPELAEIEVKLGAVKRNLTRKIGSNIAVGGAAVGVGAIVNVPLLIAATATAAAASIATIVNKHYDEKKDIELSDLYFLWKARVEHGD